MIEKLRSLVVANPRDATARSVYADALMQANDPRGTFITLQSLLQGRASPNKREDAKNQSQRLFEEHGRRWLAPASFAEVRWRGGFIHAIRAKVAEFIAKGPELVAVEPVQEVTLTNASDPDLAKLADSPALAKLELLRVQGSFTDKGATALAASKHLTKLGRLKLSGQSVGAGFAGALSNLRELRSLVLTGMGIGDEPMGALGANLPSIERLFLSRNELSDDGISALVEGGLKKLRVLAIGGNEIGDDAMLAIADAELTALEELEIDQTEVTDDGVSALSKSKKLKALREIRCRQSSVGSEKARKGLRVVAEYASGGYGGEDDGDGD